MNVKFNGKVIDVSSHASLENVLIEQAETHGFNLKVSVTAVNLQLVHKEKYGQYQLKEDDEIEVLTAVVGG